MINTDKKAAKIYLIMTVATILQHKSQIRSITNSALYKE